MRWRVWGSNAQGLRGGEHEMGSVKVLRASAVCAKSGIRPRLAAGHEVMALSVPPVWRRRLWQVSAQRQALPEALQACRLGDFQHPGEASEALSTESYGQPWAS